MSIFARPVSELYQPGPPHQLEDAELNDHYQAWGYTVGYERDAAGNDVPRGGNTAVFRIAPGGMTEPVFVTKPDPSARFDVEVLAGRGALIRAFMSVIYELHPLAEGDTFTITPGQAYSYVNTGRRDLLLRDVATPAFEPQHDEVALIESAWSPADCSPRAGANSLIANVETASGPRYVAAPAGFYELVGEAAAGRLRA